MRIFTTALLALLLLTLSGQCGLRVFRDTQGRKIVAELLDAGPDWAQIKRPDGHKFVLQLDKLSAEDKAWVGAWSRQRDAEVLAKKLATEHQAKILAWCKEQSGKQVGNGECWTLADEAFRACGMRRPGRAPRVWGRLFDLTKEKPQPGDIVEFRNARFPDSMTGPEHTAIVVALAPKGHIIIAEQNWNDVKKVHQREMDPAALQSGEMMFYRPA